MSTRYVFETDADAPFDAIRIEFDYHPAVPETGPFYASGGEPAEPALCEWTRVVVTVDGKEHEAPNWLAAPIAKKHDADLYAEAEGQVVYAREYAAELRYERMMEDA